MSRSSRIHKSTAVGALAACAVIGATSPVWANTGSSSSSDVGHAVSTQDAATISALQAEVAKLQAQLHADDRALSAATKAESLESKTAAPAIANVAPPVALTKANYSGMNGRHPCDHQGDFGDRGDFNGRGPGGPGDDHAFGADWHAGASR